MALTRIKVPVPVVTTGFKLLNVENVKHVYKELNRQ